MRSTRCRRAATSASGPGPRAGRVFCQVADTGIGMTEQVRLHIFDPFFTTKREKGKGFGLSGAYAIVDRHGGRDERGERARQGHRLHGLAPDRAPRADRAQAGRDAIHSRTRRPGRAACARKQRPGAKILVVDDSEEVREVLRELLSRHGYTVVTAPDGESGLVELETRTFDLAMVDLGLPGISGLEVAHRLKQRWPTTRVALMTGYGDRMGPEDAQARGVDFVLAKPFSLDQLRSVVEHALAQGSAELAQGPPNRKYARQPRISTADTPTTHGQTVAGPEISRTPRVASPAGSEKRQAQEPGQAQAGDQDIHGVVAHRDRPRQR